LTCKPGPFVGIENARSKNLQGPFGDTDTEVGIHCAGNIPSQDIGTVPILDFDKIDETLLQANISDCNRSNLIMMINNYISQQIWIFLMMGLAQFLLGINRLQSNLPHQPADPSIIYLMTFYSQTLRDPRNPLKREFP